jgi:hypothetical protein
MKVLEDIPVDLSKPIVPSKRSMRQRRGQAIHSSKLIPADKKQISEKTIAEI